MLNWVLQHLLNGVIMVAQSLLYVNEHAYFSVFRDLSLIPQCTGYQKGPCDQSYSLQRIFSYEKSIKMSLYNHHVE